jgi:hypothetical protein
MLDIAFDCKDGSWSDLTPFARTIELGSTLLAYSAPRHLFTYICEYLRQRCWLNKRQPGITGSEEEALRVITVDRLWYELSKNYAWNDLLQIRRAELLATVKAPRTMLRQARRIARWDIGRAIRARHAFAHRAEPLTDSYLLAVILTSLYLCLAARCFAVEQNMKFSALMHHLYTAVEEGGRNLNMNSLLLSDEWQLAQAVTE